MDCFDDDIFEFSDKDEDVSVSKTTSHKEFNPIEEHLVKQLNGIRNRIDKAKNELEEMKETIGRVSNNLAYKAVFGRDKNIDSDDDVSRYIYMNIYFKTMSDQCFNALVTLIPLFIFVIAIHSRGRACINKKTGRRQTMQFLAIKRTMAIRSFR